MVRRIPIRVKVAGALAVPLLGLVAAAAIGVSTSTAQANSVTRQADVATASIGHAGLMGALQNERNLAVAEMYGLADALELDVGDVETTRAATDAASAALHHSIAGHDDLREGDYAAALDTLDDLAAVRDQVDDALGTAGPANRDLVHEVFGSYSDMLAALFRSHDRWVLGIDDPVLRQGDDLVHYASHGNDAAGRLVEMLLYLGSGRRGIDQPVEVAQIAELRRDVERFNGSIELNAIGPYEDAVDRLFDDGRVDGLPLFASEAIVDGGPVDVPGLLDTAALGPDDGYLTFRDEVVDVLDAEAARLHGDADARRRLFLAAALALVVVALVIAWWISRSITRPLRDLSIKARSMAAYRLPASVQVILDAPSGEDLVIPEAEPIAVRTRDEVADVVQALNDVQDSALGLAVEQAALRRNVAESYINLGRRNQNLLSRLLDAVGDLERDESDPGRLRKLYRLDHLATRIRRNAESLLVLSQTGDPPPWQPPVDVSDVVRAALGEIENYERVLVRTLDPAMVVGRASADLAHLLAELIENGLRHSPPRELVEVSGRATGRGYAIKIVDHGLGMTPDDIERANQRLAGTESFTVTPAKYMGHYVTAVLAARHGIEVRLQGSVVVGIAALVDLPAALLADEDDVAEAAPPAASVVGPVAAASAGAAPVPAPAVGDRQAETPSVEDVHTALARLRSTGAAPSPTGGGALAALDALASAPSSRVPPNRAALDLVARDRASRGPAPAATTPVQPERTASGLVRRVRGAHVPAGAAIAHQNPPYGPENGAVPDARAVPDGPSSAVVVDGAEMQRFLTNLVGGVQRSLDEQNAARAARDEV